jgi:hypothetical protein
MVDLKYFKGREIIDFLNGFDDVDELYGWNFIYESQSIKGSTYKVTFSVEYGHFIKGNYITIDENGKIYARLKEPFEGCGGEEELEDIMITFINQLEISLRDNKISSIIDNESELKDRYKQKCLAKLKDLTLKIESAEDLPHSEQTSKLLSDIDDSLDEILNNWYY